MGNRGSKSGNINKPVKEQRVDGSSFVKNISLQRLRYTLMGREICYQTKILSKQFVKKNYSTVSTKNNFCNNIAPIQEKNSSVYHKLFLKTVTSSYQKFKLNPWFLTGFTDA